MPVATHAEARGWRKHVPDYWLVAAVVAAIGVSAALFLGLVPAM